MIIVAGVDDSRHGAVSAARAVEYAGRRAASLHVVHVLHIPAPLLTALSGVPAPIDEFARAQRAAVWDRIGPILDAEPDLDVTRVDLDGYPPDTLCQYADDIGADLLVVGSRGRGDLAALILGSTSHRVLHLAKCDVLIARAEEKP